MDTPRGLRLNVCDESMYFFIVLPVQLGHQAAGYKFPLNKDGKIK